MTGREIRLETGWLEQLREEFDKDYMAQLRHFLRQQGRAGVPIFPSPDNWFAAFDHTPFERVRVVILGQDPYHGLNQAHGLCFSVLPGVVVPPSLENIFAEIHRDLGIPRPDHGCLTAWAERGVLLLNSVLTVEAGRAGSHAGKGWEALTDRAVEALAARQGLVFMLWGAQAQRKAGVIDRTRHLVLESSHPSPLSVHRGFKGNGHFSKCNRYLEARVGEGVDWSLPPRGALPA